MKWIAINLLASIALGVGVCAWVLHYTGAFPQVVGLLGLGGLFAWIAFLANLLHEDTKKSLQKWFELHFLTPPKTLLWISLIAAVYFLGWAPLWGTLAISTNRDDKDRTIEVRAQGGQKEWSLVALEEQHLAPRSRHQWALRTPWFGSREYRIKVSGLPARIVQVQPWWRRPLSVPSDFDIGRHPLLLVHLSPVLNGSIHSARRPGVLQVLDEKDEPIDQLKPYLGEAVWVGGDEDIEIPARTLTLWRLALLRHGIPAEALARWEPCRSIAPNLPLSKGQRLKIRYVNPYGRELDTVVEVSPPYPQEVYFDETDQ